MYEECLRYNGSEDVHAALIWFNVSVCQFACGLHARVSLSASDLLVSHWTSNDTFIPVSRVLSMILLIILRRIPLFSTIPYI